MNESSNETEVMSFILEHENVQLLKRENSNLPLRLAMTKAVENSKRNRHDIVKNLASMK